MDIETRITARPATPPPLVPKGVETEKGKFRGQNVAIRLAADMRDVERVIESRRVVYGDKSMFKNIY